MRQLLHISDLHFGPHFLPQVADGVLDLIGRRRPDLVVISGDLTIRAKRRQFRAARRFVDAVPAPTICVPGNHDVPMYRAWERALVPYGAYRRHFSPELEPTFEDGEMLVVGINTAFSWTVKDGRITRASLRRAEAALAAAPAGVVKIVVAHHELVPAPRFDRQRVLRGAAAAVEVFTRTGVEMVLSGHLHQSFLLDAGAYYPAARRPLLLVHSGTTTCSRGRGVERGRNTCNWIEIDRDELRISNLDWDGSRFQTRSRHHFPRRGREPYTLGPA